MQRTCCPCLQGHSYPLNRTGWTGERCIDCYPGVVAAVVVAAGAALVGRLYGQQASAREQCIAGLIDSLCRRWCGRFVFRFYLSVFVCSLHLVICLLQLRHCSNVIR